MDNLSDWTAQNPCWLDNLFWGKFEVLEYSHLSKKLSSTSNNKTKWNLLFLALIKMEDLHLHLRASVYQKDR